MSSKLRQHLEEQAKKSILSYSFYRPESALLIAMTLILTTLSAMSFSWFPVAWWVWPLFGLVGESLIILTTLRDDKFYRQVLAKMLRQTFDPSQLQNTDLKKKLATALEYQEKIVTEIEREKDAVMDDHLMTIAATLEDWIAQLFRLAHSIDVYLHDTIVARDLETVPQELQKLRARLDKEHEKTVRHELENTIATKEGQWQTLQTLRDTITKAQLQLENTTAAIGTIYTQVVLLGAKDVDSTRAQRLQADVADQVRALEDLQQAMDEVYQQK